LTAANNLPVDTPPFPLNTTFKYNSAWNNKTREYLIKIYGAGSPNIDTIVKASGSTPVWMGMPQAVCEKFEASSIENKIQMLATCVVSLKLKSDQLKMKKKEAQRSQQE